MRHFALCTIDLKWISQWYEPWKPLVTVDCGLCWVEKLPVLTLSNKPFKLIASVEIFEREIVFGFTVDGVDSFSKVCGRWKVKLIIFQTKKICYVFCCCSISANLFSIFFALSLGYALNKQEPHNRNQFMFASHLSACRHRNSFMTWLNVSSK